MICASTVWPFSLFYSQCYDLTMTQILEQQIKSLIRKTVKETLRDELAHLRAEAFPLVANEEMADIARRYKKPTRRAARVIRTSI